MHVDGKRDGMTSMGTMHGVQEKWKNNGPFTQDPLVESSNELIKALHWEKWEGNGTTRDSLKTKERGHDLILEEDPHDGKESPRQSILQRGHFGGGAGRRRIDSRSSRFHRASVDGARTRD
jgi:hypothetical protein